MNKTGNVHLYLKPGEISIIERPAIITTILGSCIAVTLFNKRLGMAAISHALLPHCKRHVYKNYAGDLLNEDCAKCPEAYRYVDCSVSMMIEAFSRSGIAASETQVQLFGGAKMIASPKQSAGIKPVGLQNLIAAKKVIADHGLTIHCCDVGGTAGRKISFNTKTGIVVLRQ